MSYFIIIFLNMRTFLRTCIIVISLAIITIFTADYNTTLSTRLCQNINFCTTIKNNTISTPPQIIYTTGTKIYDEIRFYQDNSGDIARFEELKSTGYTCGLWDDGGWYGIWGGALWCEQVPWYYHQYDIPERGIRFIAYNNILPEYSNVSISKKNIDIPFHISGNQLIDNSSDFYIEYNTRTDKDIPISIMKDRPDTIIYQWSEYKRDGELFADGTSYRIINDDEITVSPIFNLNLHFKLLKDYYYTTWLNPLWCAPGPCGIWQHSIEYFRK